MVAIQRIFIIGNTQRTNEDTINKDVLPKATHGCRFEFGRPGQPNYTCLTVEGITVGFAQELPTDRELRESVKLLSKKSRKRRVGVCDALYPIRTTLDNMS